MVPKNQTNSKDILEEYVPKIECESWKKELFCDQKIMNVFVSLTYSPKSAKQISEDTGLPLTTVYRKLRKLKTKQLVSVSGTITDKGARNFLYSKP